MDLTLRRLDPVADRASVADLALRVADYIRLETGEAPGPGWAGDFFADAPPGGGPADLLQLGLFRGARMAGAAAMSFGYPEPGDAYLGLMLIDAAERGAGLGRRLLAAVEAEARRRGASRLYLAVLEENPRGRAFWEREGFRPVLTKTDVAFGAKRHVVHRMMRPL
jgi:GNAT superfamily N-acetyltransferase